MPPTPKDVKEATPLFRNATVVLVDGKVDSAYAAVWAARKITGNVIVAHMIWDGGPSPTQEDRSRWIAERLGLLYFSIRCAPFPRGGDGRFEGLVEGLIRACSEHDAKAVVIGCQRSGLWGGPYGSTAKEVAEIGARVGIPVMVPAAVCPKMLRNLILNMVGLYPARLAI